MKVYFFQDNSFFRTKKGTNPFFDSIIEVCERNGIGWKVWTCCPSAGCGYPVAKVGYFGWFNALAIGFWRVTHLFWRVESWRIWYLWGRLMRPFCRNRFEADLFITIAGNMTPSLAGMFPKVRIADMQHGVIFSEHRGYFEAGGRLSDKYRRLRRCEFWLYGRGYANCFFRNPSNRTWLEGRVKVLGDVFGHPPLPLEPDRNVIAFSAQLTADFGARELGEMVRRMRDFFEEAHAHCGAGYRYVLKQHPRFNRCDISALTSLDYLEIVDTSWSDLYPEMVIHVTFSSTVCFDCASCGIPTYFLPYYENAILDSRYYRDDFVYPYFGISFADLLMLQAKDSEQMQRTIREWYETCYAPFCEERCLALLKGEDSGGSSLMPKIRVERAEEER